MEQRLRIGALARQACNPVHHLGLDLPAGLAAPASGGRPAHPAQSGPRYSASDDVTSIERFSIRPCPLSISQARSISASRRAAWRGGKAGLRLGKGSRDVPAERRLVLLHRQHVITSPFDHLRTEIAVREHAIASDDLALDREHPQELQSGLVLIGLGIDPELSQDRLDVRSIGRHQVNPGVSPSRLPRAVLPSMDTCGASSCPSRP